MATNPRADQWEIICLPALALDETEYPADQDAQRTMMLDGVYLPFSDPLGRQPEQALCPQMTNQGVIQSIRANISPYNWQSIYQQMPFMRSGGKFKRHWFKVEEKLPDEVKFVKAVWYWDQAAKEGAGDYSAGVLMAVDQFGRLWVLVVVRDQYSTFTRRQAMRQAYLSARARFGERVPVPQLWHQQDPGSAGLDSARDTNKALAGLPAHFEPVSGDKETRADPWSSALESDNVVLLKGGWNQAFIDEHLSFPKGRNDDQVDAAASAYTKLTGSIEVGMVAYAQKQLDRIKAEKEKAEKEKAAKELADGTHEN
jgi:predicted phage terminase large subunit-like protein